MNGFQRYIIGKAQTFEDFIRHCDAECHDADGSKWIYRNQLDYLTDADGTVIVDYIGRFERLQADFAAAAARLGLQGVAIPHINRSIHPSYTQYYSGELRDFVGEMYARDIAAFGYRFESVHSAPGESLVRPS